MDSALVSEVLIKTGKRVCSSRDIAGISKTEYLKAITKLINTKWIYPLEGFKGIYYVLDSEEREGQFLKLDSFTVLIRALNIYLGNQWYFGRITALSLSGLINQPVSTYYILNKKHSKEIVSSIFGKVVFVKTTADIIHSCGLTKVKYQGIEYQLCGTERNMADYLYSYVHGHANKEQLIELYRRYKISKEKLIEISLRCYPKRSAIKMLAFAKAVDQ
ncbi:MAG: hypothetical protein V1492_02140 [Candidatus Micrarchaeota archaeon]